MRITANYLDGITTVRALIDHPMESGLRSDLRGNRIPENRIHAIKVTCRNSVVMEVEVGTALAKNPYLSFDFEDGEVGDEIEVSWTDTKEQSKSKKLTIKQHER